MTYRDEVLADSPIAYWRLEETSGSTLTDETGNGHDGTTVNSPLLNVSGQVDSAIHFDDAIDRFDTDTLGSLGSDIATGATLEVWAKWSHSNAGQTVGGVLNSGTSMGWYIAINWDESASSDPGNIFSFLRDDNNNQIWAAPSTNPGLNDGVWHHIVWVAEDPANNVMKCYIDGSEVTLAYSNQQSPSTFSNFDQNWPWGARNGAGTVDQEAICFLDEPAVYGTILSATRVQAHYDAAQPTAETITFDPHTVLLKHRPLFEGVFSPHTVVFNHFKAVPLQPHSINLLHRGNVAQGDDSEEGQATALRKLLGYGWGVPDPVGSANEKIETPRESWPIHRFHEAERLLRQEGVEEPTAQALGDALRRLGEDIHLDVKENLQRYEWHANAHTHSGLAGAEGTPRGPAEALFTVSGGGVLQRRLTSDGSIFWSRGDNYGDLAVDPVERRVYAIGRSDTDNQYIDRVVSYDFDGVEQWNIDLHSRIGDASETVWAFTLARDKSALYTIYNDGSQFGVVRIGTSDGSVSVIGKDTPSSTDFYPTATFDTDGDYLYFADRAFHGGDRGRIIKFSLGDGHIVWEMSPDLASQHDCPLCVTDTLLWAQKSNGQVILVDKASGGINSIVDLSGADGAAGGNLWKDFHNTNSLYVLGTNFNVPDTWLYRLYPIGGVLQAEELKFFENIDMGRVIRDGEGNFFLGGGSGSTSHLMKLSPDLEVKWQINGPSPRNFCTDQGRSVHWG